MEELLRLARRQLASDGAPGLSLRAIARDMGLVSSAVYRYVASRDDLLTLLIIESYEAIGEVAEKADASVRDRDDVMGRWMAIARATRRWAVANPSDFGLIYGTPVPGYVAPPDTVPAALRLYGVFSVLLNDAEVQGCTPLVDTASISSKARADVRLFASRAGIEVSAPLGVAGLMAWSQMIGVLTLELGGHFHNVIDDTEAWFEQVALTSGMMFGLAREPRRSR